MKYYLIAGEASGDLHGSNLMAELKKKDEDAKFRFWGGDFMLRQSDNIAVHYKDIAFMGFVEVLQNLGRIFRNINLCKKDIIKYNPDAIILIDYPGFNLRIAGFAKKEGFRVYYYISPKVWAWKQSRVKKIKKFVDKMFVILPFEVEFYRKNNFDVYYVGNPVLDSIEEKRKYFLSKKDFISKNKLSGKPIIALLPGSRKQEIKKMLPVMSELASKYPEHQLTICAVRNLPAELYLSYLPENSNIKIVFDQTYELLSHSVAAIVTSGTATLEVALLNVPEVVCYLANELSYQIGKRIVSVPYISLVNLIMEKEIVRELIQSDMSVNSVKDELDRLIFDNDYRDRMFGNYEKLRNKLGKPGASGRAAKLLIDDLEK